MSTDEYVPDEEAMEVAWIEFEASAEDINAAADEFDRFLARVRRDAAKAAWDEAIEEALDGWTIPASGDIEAVRFILLSTNPYMPEEPAP